MLTFHIFNPGYEKLDSYWSGTAEDNAKSTRSNGIWTRILDFWIAPLPIELSSQLQGIGSESYPNQVDEI